MASNEAAGSYTPRRGRPDQAQVAAIEDTIRSTARAMFLERGYAETSIEAIATAAGVSKGTLYARFSDKQALFQAIMRERIEFWSTLLPPDDFADTMSAPERMMRRGLTVLRVLRLPEVAAFIRLFDAEAGRFPQLAETAYHQGTEVFRRMIADDIRLGAARQGMVLTDPEGVAELFSSALHGWVGLRRGRSLSDDDCSAFVARLVAILVGGRAAW